MRPFNSLYWQSAFLFFFFHQVINFIDTFKKLTLGFVVRVLSIELISTLTFTILSLWFSLGLTCHSFSG